MYKRCKKRKTLRIQSFNKPLSVEERTSGQKIREEIEGLMNLNNRLDLMDVYWPLPPKNWEYTFFSGIKRYFSK